MLRAFSALLETNRRRTLGFSTSLLKVHISILALLSQILSGLMYCDPSAYAELISWDIYLNVFSSKIIRHDEKVGPSATTISEGVSLVEVENAANRLLVILCMSGTEKGGNSFLPGTKEAVASLDGAAGRKISSNFSFSLLHCPSPCNKLDPTQYSPFLIKHGWAAAPCLFAVGGADLFNCSTSF